MNKTDPSHRAGCRCGIGRHAASARRKPGPTSRPHFLVPYPGGGIVDIVARTLADPMQADLGQPVVVEPKPGGNSTIATALIAAGPGRRQHLGDGDHFAMSWRRTCRRSPTIPSPTSSRPPSSRSPPRSRRSIPSVPVKTLKELVDYGKANPGKLHYLNPGNGSSIHLSAELLKNQCQVRHDLGALQRNPAGNARPAGRPPAGRPAARAAGPSACRRRASCGRSPCWPTSGCRQLPDVPTFAEAGFADAQVTSWYVIAVRAGTPPAIVDRLHGCGDEGPPKPGNASAACQGRLRRSRRPLPRRGPGDVEGRLRALRQTGQGCGDREPKADRPVTLQP